MGFEMVVSGALPPWHADSPPQARHIGLGSLQVFPQRFCLLNRLARLHSCDGSLHWRRVAASGGLAAGAGRGGGTCQAGQLVQPLCGSEQGGVLRQLELQLLRPLLELELV